MLSCRDITEQATAYEEGALGWFARLSFRAHLMMCEHCRRYVRQFEATVAALKRRAGGEPGPGDQTRASLLAAFRARTTRPGGPPG